MKLAAKAILFTAMFSLFFHHSAGASTSVFDDLIDRRIPDRDQRAASQQLVLLLTKKISSARMEIKTDALTSYEFQELLDTLKANNVEVLKVQEFSKIEVRLRANDVHFFGQQIFLREDLSFNGNIF